MRIPFFIVDIIKEECIDENEFISGLNYDYDLKRNSNAKRSNSLVSKISNTASSDCSIIRLVCLM